jgi:hypothetical protein
LGVVGARQLEMINPASTVVAGDDRILAAWTGGSLANDMGDEFADVDLNLLVADHDMAAFSRCWPDLVRRVAPMVTVQPIGGVVGGYAITRDRVHVDVPVACNWRFPGRSQRTMPMGSGFTSSCS